MQKWEYLIVKSCYSRINVENYAYMVNGNVVEQQPVLWDIANGLGIQGWELVTVIANPGSLTDFSKLIFKRPLN